MLVMKAPTLADAQQVRLWRNDLPETLRTPYLLTEKMQEDFYYKVVCDRNAGSRWWSFYIDGELIGFAGLTGIEWENGLAEISLIIAPEARGGGHGRAIARRVLHEAFYNMGLKTVYGECYECNPAVAFWKKLTDEQVGYYTIIPRRKKWRGELYNALHFTIWR